MSAPLITDEVTVRAIPDSGTQQTIPLALGGLTPWYVSIIAYRTTVDDDETGTGTFPAAGAACSWGCTDGTNEWVMAIAAKDDATPLTVSHNWLRSTRMVQLMDPVDGSDDASASFVSWTANAITIDWDSGPDSAWHLVVYAMAGGGGSAEVGIATGDTDTGDTVAVGHSLGVAPRGFVAATGSRLIVADTSSANNSGRFTLGYGSYDGSTIRQCGSAIGWVQGSLTGVIGARLSTDRILAPVTIPTIDASGQPHLSITAVDDTDVTFTTLNQPAAMDFGYAFIAGVECFAGVWTVPSGTGSKTFDMPSGPNDVRPKGILFTHTRLQPADFDAANSTVRAGTMGWSAIGSSGASGTGNITQARLTVPTNTATYYDDRAYYNHAHDGGGAQPSGEWTSFDSDGWTLNSLTGNASEIGFPMLLMGGIRLAPTGLAVPVAFGAPDLRLVVEPDGLDVPISFGSPALSLLLAPGGLAVPIDFGSPSLSLLLAPDGLAVPIDFGSPNLSLLLSPDGLALAIDFGSPDLTLVIFPDGLALAVAFGQPAFALTQLIAPAGLAVPISFGSPDLTLVIFPDGLALPIAFGSPTLSTTFVVSPTGLALPIAFGSVLFPGMMEFAPGPQGQVVQSGPVLGMVAQSGMVAGQTVHGGPVAGQVSQGGAVAGNVVQGGAVAGQVSTDA